MAEQMSPSVIDFFLGCWDGISKGIDTFAQREGINISSLDARQALIEPCTETFVRALIEIEFGYTTNTIEGDFRL